MAWELKRYDDHTLHLINTDIDDLLDIEDARIAAERTEKERLNTDHAAETYPADAGVESGSPPSTSPPATSTTTVTSESTEEKAAPAVTMDVETTDEVKGVDLKLTGSGGRYAALCLHFTLPSASYATMCIREITKQDTGTNFQTSLNPPGSTQQQNMPKSSGDSHGAGPGEADEGGTAAASCGEEKGGAKASPPKGAVIKIGASFSG